MLAQLTVLSWMSLAPCFVAVKPAPSLSLFTRLCTHDSLLFDVTDLPQRNDVSGFYSSINEQRFPSQKSHSYRISSKIYDKVMMHQLQTGAIKWKFFTEFFSILIGILIRILGDA
jgi:hypothetical protein